VNDIQLVRWGAADGELLARLLGDPAMTEHLGGPETPEQIAARQLRYEATETGLYKIVVDGEDAGWVGWWERDGDYEIGWAVLPEQQGRGIAAAATRRALEHAKADGRFRYVHAYPAVDNAPSNAICRKVGFELLGAFDFEYPPGNPLRCNDWRFDLSLLEDQGAL
jgi:RimJ/RimL family protein N-acetyltransferase